MRDRYFSENVAIFSRFTLDSPLVCPLWDIHSRIRRFVVGFSRICVGEKLACCLLG